MTVAIKGKTPEEKTQADISRFFDDPLGFVKYSFAWGEGDLSGSTGPDEWQAELLTAIGDWSKTGDGNALQSAVSSGHGSGKGARHEDMARIKPLAQEMFHWSMV